MSSVRKTGRLVVVHEASSFLGMASEISAQVTEQCFYELEAPVIRVGGANIPYPPSRMEEEFLPDLDRILDGVDRALFRVLSRGLRHWQSETFNLPDPGEGLVEAEIVEWKVAPGDTVKVNDMVLEIETAKSLVELPIPWAGTVKDLLVEVGQTIDVGTPIISIDDGLGGDDAPAAPSIPGERRLRTKADQQEAILVGYGAKAGATARRARKQADGRMPPSPVPTPRRLALGSDRDRAGGGRRAHRGGAGPGPAHGVASPRGAGSMPWRRWPARVDRRRSRRCASWPRTSASTSASVHAIGRRRHHHPRRRPVLRRRRERRSGPGRSHPSRGGSRRGSGSEPSGIRIGVSVPVSARSASRSRVCAR